MKGILKLSSATVQRFSSKNETETENNLCEILADVGALSSPDIILSIAIRIQYGI
jgi:hypothetical protein